MNAASAAIAPFAFPLIWTIGFSGKRHVADEAKVARALESALTFLHHAADQQGSTLTGISSIARGGDVLFAEACQCDLGARPALPWKCLLPFAWDRFVEFDLATAADRAPLPAEEKSQREARADLCLRGAFDEPGIVCPRTDPRDDEQRIASYLECGYRTVDEADVMILLLRAEEFAQVKEHAVAMEQAQAAGRALSSAEDAGAALAAKAGTRSVALYAIAARRPCLLLDVEADDPWAARYFAHEPKGADALFVDPIITPLVRHAEHVASAARRKDLRELSGPVTPARTAVWELMWRFGAIAGHNQGRALGGMKWMLSLHLAACAIAAIGATLLAYGHGLAALKSALLVVALLGLAFAKPVLAAIAWRIEHQLHKKHAREEWLNARVLAELCRGAVSLWPLPEQPLDAMDDEDFPKMKRLIRTLRLQRTLDRDAAVTGSPRRGDLTKPAEAETQREADMRVAIDHYVSGRLRDQIDGYFRKKLPAHQREEARWRHVLHAALALTIVFGLIFAAHKVQLRFAGDHHAAPTTAAHDTPAPAAPEAHASEHPAADPWRWMEALIIICPFVASFALGMMTLLDCRRRVRRYPEMAHYLSRLADTLALCRANPSRLRLIEQAERMMIEEQHEWFSVTRNFSV